MFQDELHQNKAVLINENPNVEDYHQRLSIASKHFICNKLTMPGVFYTKRILNQKCENLERLDDLFQV